MAKGKPSKRARPASIGDWKNVLVEIADGIAWVTLNRPEKRNAMSPALNNEMVAVLDAVELADEAGVLVLTGAGDPSSYSDDVLPDVYSGTFSYGYNPGVSSAGARVVVQRKISDDLTATVDYSTGQAIVAESAADWQALAQALSTSRRSAAW